MGDAAGGGGQCAGRAAVVAQDLPALHTGQRVFHPSTNLAVVGVELFPPVRQRLAIGPLAIRAITPVLPW